MIGTYNERLFGSNSVRKWLHIARFKWLRNKCIQYKPSVNLVVELGCYDGRSLEYLPEKPHKYYGFDANWEQGLDIAQNKWHSSAYSFVQCASANDMIIDPGENVSLAISLETLEHIPEYLLIGYLKTFSNILDGYLFVTVPNEKGIIFLVKYIVKGLFLKNEYQYSFKEVLAATFGKMDSVKRNDHKGFDWQKLLGDLKEYFEVLEVQGVQFPLLPAWSNAQIGFVLMSKSMSLPLGASVL
jgi:hypothetical protein